MNLTIPKSALDTFSRLSTRSPQTIDALTKPGKGRPEALRNIRVLERLGLVEVATRRPKTARVSPSVFPTALHGVLAARPHLRALVAGNRILVASALATSENPLSVTEISHHTGLHFNTVRTILRSLLDRSMLRRTRDARYQIAPHAFELASIGRFFRNHLHELLVARYPESCPVLQKGLRLIVESGQPMEGLPSTAFFRFQEEGASVLSPRFQYAISVSGQKPTLDEAFQDALELHASPRTEQAMRDFLGKGTE